MTVSCLYFRRNIIGFENNTQLQSCLYKKDHAKYQFCPIFQLQDIAMYADVEFNDLADKVKPLYISRVLVEPNCHSLLSSLAINSSKLFILHDD